MPIEAIEGAAVPVSITKPSAVPINLGFMSLRKASFPERMAAASAAGFAGVSLRIDQWDATKRAGWSAARVRELLDSHRLTVSEIEPLRFLRDDFVPPMEEMIREFAVPRVQVTPAIDGSTDELPATARWLRDIANRFPSTGLSIEFLPTTSVPDAPAALRLIEAAGGAPNLGLCVDSWHVFRGAGLDSLDGIDPARVFLIQIDDGPMRPALPDYFPDTLKYRRPCGEGEFDLVSFLRLLPKTAPVNVEVISDLLDQLPSGEVAKRLHDTTRAVLERAWG